MSSRESDSAYPPPRRGPDAYPSGTPPYGTGIPAGFPADPFSQAGQPSKGPKTPDEDVPKTETTLTTRVRINIPGSRPIPPVVVRSAVKNEEPAAAAPSEPAAGPRHRAETPTSPVLGVVDAGVRSATPPNLPPEWQESRQAPGQGGGPSDPESTGEWFKPRQKRPADRQDAKGPAPVPAGAPAPGQGAPAGPPHQAAMPRPSGTPASPFAAAEQPGMPEDPFARPASAGGAPEGRFAADPFAPGPRQEAPAGAPGTRAPQGGEPVAGRRPTGRPAPDAEPEDTQVGGFEPIRDDIAPGGIPGAPAGRRPGVGGPPPTGRFATNGRGVPADPFAAPGPGHPAGAPRAADPFAPQSQVPPVDPAAAPPGSEPFAAAPDGRFADIPADPASPFPTHLKAATPPRRNPGEPRPQPTATAEEAPAAPAPVKRRSRGPKLAVYAVGGLMFAGAAAYGTGLMMNQSDIPKGTTVLGTKIGGDTRDQAVSALDSTVGKAGQAPVKLTIGGQDVQLDPASAGLSFDTTATVDALTKHSYNPMDVIGSLAGRSKAVAPVVRVDEAKLKSALDGLAAASGQGLQEGFVQFTEDGKAVVVPGKAGQALDATAAVGLVEQAYRNRAAGQPDAAVTLSLAAAQPKIGQDAIQAAADGLGKQVLNGTITVTAGGKSFTFGAKTAAKALTLVATDDTGKTFVAKWDNSELEKALGTTFDKVKIRKNGALTQITTQDVEDAIASAFDKTGSARKITLPS